MEAKGQTPTPEACPSGWLRDAEGKVIAHVLRSPYGLGTYTFYWDSYWEPYDEPDPPPRESDLIS